MDLQLARPMVQARASGSGRIATLDGLRGISILLVLFGHAFGTGILPRTKSAHLVSEIGVRTFFVISGFLITTLLVRERARHGRISLFGFYKRRTLRIFPAFYGYLAVVALLSIMGLAPVAGHDLANAATYTMNFHTERPWLLGHLWSLSVEEQFYLIWPLVLVLIGVTRAASFAVVAIVAAPILRLVAWYRWPELRGLTDQALPFVFDSLATGCALAIARDRLEASPRYRAVLDAPSFWLIPAFLMGAMVITRPWFDLGVGTTLVNLGIAFAVHHCVSRPTGIVGQFLERRSLVWIGTLSYSLYLWQQPFMNRSASAWINIFPINIVLAFAAAMVWYYAVERPMLRLRRAPETQPEPIAHVAIAPIAIVEMPAHEITLINVTDLHRLPTDHQDLPAKWMRDLGAQLAQGTDPHIVADHIDYETYELEAIAAVRAATDAEADAKQSAKRTTSTTLSTIVEGATSS
jgi:peptidoglycan/LPS O-acetylase OafA/YrhL